MNKTNNNSSGRRYMAKSLCVLALGAVSLSAQSALLDGQTRMTFNAKYLFDTGECEIDPALTDGVCVLPIIDVRGSYFTMGGTPADKGVSLTSYDGILLGQGQPAGTGVHGGNPQPSDSGAVTNPWLYFNSTGHEFTVNNGVTVASQSGNTAMLNFSNWRVGWNNVPEINMGGSPDPVYGDTGLASISCWSDSTLALMMECGYGAFYVLDYKAVVPNDGLTSFGGVKYEVHLEGTINPVPVPAAAWLFGSGLIGFVGMAFRKTKNITDVS